MIRADLTLNVMNDDIRVLYEKQTHLPFAPCSGDSFWDVGMLKFRVLTISYDLATDKMYVVLRMKIKLDASVVRIHRRLIAAGWRLYTDNPSVEIPEVIVDYERENGSTRSPRSLLSAHQKRLAEMSDRVYRLVLNAQTIRKHQVKLDDSETAKASADAAWKAINEDSESLVAELGKLKAIDSR